MVFARHNVWLSLGWSLVLGVIYLSLTPNPPSTDAVYFGDKIGHFLAYATLMSWWSQLDSRHCRIALLFVLMGLALEIAQSFTDYRQGDLFDMAANSLGVGMGWLSTWLKPDWLHGVDRRLAA
ncbi:MAG: VanZ family protein [Hydrogenophilales bacterium CG17_big_fil_post_rev_8_21_14_2_50_63_12]|nr:MAG: VanZ family protein [Hydrogenophilales bacterium CG17_big_fil_post_rev_8_21_14_2_50_63_12]PIX95653.1 MAG: VanZ family protein [Hydrogenophilales bacterium CG_4_10_14_3_um_filter_63_21]PJB07658.1 MAG: VanZ family protein [Hydrogenophilales bacterium CG_4_9_14_3_um_filter_63_34]